MEGMHPLTMSVRSEDDVTHRNLGNEPTGDVPKGTNPRKFFTTGDDSQKSKGEWTLNIPSHVLMEDEEHFNKEWKDNAKHNSFPGTDPKEKH